MENVRKHRNIRLAVTKQRRNYLISEPNYHATKIFSENLLAIEIEKTQILMNKPGYFGLSILELSKIVMYEFWYDYVKPKHGEKAKLCYMNTDSFIVYIKPEDINAEFVKVAKTTFETSNYERNKPLPKGKNKKKLLVQ